MSPYIRKGKTVYKKTPSGKLESRGSSKDVATAKAHMRALYAAEGSNRGSTRKRSKG